MSDRDILLVLLAMMMLAMMLLTMMLLAMVLLLLVVMVMRMLLLLVLLMMMMSVGRTHNLDRPRRRNSRILGSMHIHLSSQLTDLHLQHMALENHFLNFLVSDRGKHLELVAGVLHRDGGAGAGAHF